MDRRAVIVGNWQCVSHNGPNHAKIKSLIGKLGTTFGSDGDYPFFSMKDQKANPDCFLNPGISDLTKLITEDSIGVSDDTLVLFYYLGNSKPDGDHDLRLILKVEEKNGKEISVKLSELMKQFYDNGVKKMIMILDSCHVGRVQRIVDDFSGECYSILATGSGYTFNADFTERVLSTLEKEPHKNDQRIDRKIGGVTFEKIFQVTSGNLRRLNRLDNYVNTPKAFGSLGKEILREAAPLIPKAFNPLATTRSVYGRTFFLLNSLRDKSLHLDELMNELRCSSIFLISTSHDGEPRYVNKHRFSKYINFLIKLGFIVGSSGSLELTDEGAVASEKEKFNERLLACIEEKILPENISLATISIIVSELLENMIQPSPKNIHERAQMNDLDFSLNEETRFALDILPSTGRFLKGSADAIFPSEIA